ncbi:hypothetical protein M3P36_06900 [Altererythrobacter sp. KTW20L]|uniref:HWE histidine kinase domain-containing protein n=1 Tax=Altererythrobacter sp. KTW20L TaxID=2942210 RepID=UPI0020C16EF2|nr:HWE histidine kinase domain-containing protein [Altererythrobacter sp. KTW20L]MCL6250772.1 hypothetical protein [Altererythrobacter sp. KTW20L]
MAKFPLIRDALLAKRSRLECFYLAGFVMGTATAIRLVLEPYVPNMPFLTYLPSVMIIALVTDWRWGAAVSVASAILGASLFGSSSTFYIQFFAFLIVSSIVVGVAELLRRLVADLEVAKKAAEHQTDELLHRVGNTLAIVQAIATQTLRISNPDEFPEAFRSRLLALGNAYTLLRKVAVNRCRLRTIVLEACSPFCGRQTLELRGPDCHLPAQSCVPLLLFLHELAANAVMHGALTVPGGRIAVTWVVDEQGKAVVTWKEVGGPPDAATTGKDMGALFLRTQNGLTDVKVVHETSGIHCVIVIEGAELD